ncbi:MAG: hypothetical protein U0871_13755 [Gemmataceae bacterium]
MSAAPPPAVRPLEARLAPVMTAVAFVYLLAVAGVIHRAGEPEATAAERRLITWVLAGVWPVFVAEGALAFRRRVVPARTAALRVFLVLTFPPFRVGWVHPAADRIWLPGLGWHPPGRPLLKVLDRLFGWPMVAFALLILPVLLLDQYQAKLIHDTPGLTLALNVSTAVIWLAFALEFVVKVQAAPTAAGYLKERWLDVVIVALPTLEFVLTHWVDAAPLARLLRLGRALSAPQQHLGAMTRVYRVRGLMVKGWQAFLVLEGLARLTGATPEKRLRKLEAQMAVLEEQLAELRAEADGLRKRIGNGPG